MSGPPGSRSRHLGIKSPGQVVAACGIVSHAVAKLLVKRPIRQMRSDRLQRGATHCNALVGTGNIDCVTKRTNNQTTLTNPLLCARGSSTGHEESMFAIVARAHSGT
jgi:hypothetical protein